MNPRFACSSAFVVVVGFMKSYLYFGIVLTMAFGCKSNQDKIGARNSIERVISLKNELGNATIVVPARYDTVIQWTSKSDCISCGYEEYRIQLRANPIRLETGSIWYGDPGDSVDDITLSHSVDRYSFDSLVQISASDHKRIVHEYNADPVYFPLVKDTMLKIGSRMYSISYSSNYDSTKGLFRRALISGTRVYGEEVFIVFRTWAKQPIDEKYFSKSLDILHTVKFSNGR